MKNMTYGVSTDKDRENFKMRKNNHVNKNNIQMLKWAYCLMVDSYLRKNGFQYFI